MMVETPSAEELVGKGVCVVGFGRSGRAALRLLTKLGAKAFVSEAKPYEDLPPEVRAEADALARAGIEFEFGAHRTLAGADLVVLSPGISLERIRKEGYAGPIWGEIELATRFIPVRPIAVTGTNGKTTTASLIAHILRVCHPERAVHLRGNIGQAASDIGLEVSPRDFVVLEVSSFQLETTETFAPSVAVLLNIAPDHLDRYPDLAAYAAAKERIFMRMGKGDTAIVNVDDPLARAAFERIPSGVRKVGVRADDADWNGLAPRFGAIPQENLRAAAAAAEAVGMTREKIREAIATFEPMPHRLEIVAEVGGVRFYNDSKATNFHAVAFAVRTTPRPIVLLLGGRSKGEDPATLLPHLEGVQRVVAFGEMRRSLVNALDGTVPVTSVETMDEAVNAAFNAAESGTSVLFSPGGSSFDAFRNYEERGRAFQEAARRLATKE